MALKIEEAFSYQFEDAAWLTKLGIGALLSLVPVLSLAVVGYQVRIIRNVAAGASRPLPEWDDVGGKLRDGFLLLLASLIYAAPVMLTVVLAAGLIMITGATANGLDSRPFDQQVGPVGTATLFCLLAIMLGYSFLLSLMRPLILILFSRDGTLASCFRFREMRLILAHATAPFVRTWTVIFLAGFLVGSVVGLVNLIVGWLPCFGWMAGIVLGLGSAMYVLTSDAHLFGQFRLAALDR